MRIRIYYFIFLLITAVAVVMFLIVARDDGQKVVSQDISAQAILASSTVLETTATTSAVSHAVKTDELVNTPLSVSTTPTGASPEVSTSTAVFLVEGLSYTVAIEGGQTVVGVMQTLADTSSFTFTAKEYSGMGMFVDSVNGKKNDGNMYWILYINGESSKVGASLAVVKPGDVVEWRYKKNGDY